MYVQYVHEMIFHFYTYEHGYMHHHNGPLYSTFTHTRTYVCTYCMYCRLVRRNLAVRSTRRS